MADAKDKKNDGPEWGGFKGTPVAGSLLEGDAVEGKGVASAEFTAGEKTHTVIAYKDDAAAKLKEAVEAGKEVTVRGPMLGSSNKGTFHFGAAQFKAPGEPKVEKTEEEKAADKAARAEANRARALEADKTRFPVVAGDVSEGDSITVDGNDVTVASLGAKFTVDADKVADFEERFGVTFEAGTEIQYAKYEEPDMSPSP